MLVNILLRYFSQDLSVAQCQFDGDIRTKGFVRTGSPSRGEIRYCEYYLHCRKVPCPEQGISKNHDFNLDLEIPDKFVGIFQYRHPVPAIVSWYRFSVARGNTQDNQPAWQDWLAEKLVFWKALMAKWYYHDRVSMKLDYDAFVASPLATVRRFLELSVAGHVDHAGLEAAVKAENVRPKYWMRNFPYLTPEQVTKIEVEADICKYGIQAIHCF